MTYYPARLFDEVVFIIYCAITFIGFSLLGVFAFIDDLDVMWQVGIAFYIILIFPVVLTLLFSVMVGRIGIYISEDEFIYKNIRRRRYKYSDIAEIIVLDKEFYTKIIPSYTKNYFTIKNGVIQSAKYRTIFLLSQQFVPTKLPKGYLSLDFLNHNKDIIIGEALYNEELIKFLMAKNPNIKYVEV